VAQKKVSEGFHYESQGIPGHIWTIIHRNLGDRVDDWSGVHQKLREKPGQPSKISVFDGGCGDDEAQAKSKNCRLEDEQWEEKGTEPRPYGALRVGVEMDPKSQKEDNQLNGEVDER
tara:strand:- start:103 stop:453 length:351 start_codon:yes stop_codon:yes gene_type:complete